MLFNIIWKYSLNSIKISGTEYFRVKLQKYDINYCDLLYANSFFVIPLRWKQISDKPELCYSLVPQIIKIITKKYSLWKAST